MAMFAELVRLVGHSLRYAAGSLFAMLAGMVSFSILTRNLPVSDYGRLSLITITITLVVTFAKLGMSHATVRFYSDARSGSSGLSLRNYYGTVLASALATGLLFAVCMAAVSYGLAVFGIADARVATLMQLASSMVFLRVLFSSVQNIARAEENSGLFAVYQSLSKISWLVIISTIAVSIGLTLENAVVALLISDTLVVSVAVLVLFRQRSVSLFDFSPALLRSMLVFGVPLLGMEAADTILQTADRYVINGFLGPESVGIYAAACTLSEYANSLIALPASLAILPMFLRIYERNGLHATREFLNKCISIAAIIFPAVVAGAAVVSPDILRALSGEHYIPAAALVPIIVASLSVSACTPVFAASLNIKKMTTVIFKIAGFGAVFNILLNVLLIPRMGITGAALSTFVSYALMLAATIKVSRPIRVDVPWSMLLKYTIVAVIMFRLLVWLDWPPTLSGIAGKIVVGAGFYCAVVLILEKEIRNVIRNHGLLGKGIA